MASAAPTSSPPPPPDDAFLDHEDEEEDEEEEEDETAPFAANAENRKLNSLVKEGERNVLRTEAEVEEQTNRVKVMAEHLSAVQQELQHTQVRGSVWMRFCLS
jgi:molecular chaperone GrpE (heat shock protein)